ncbi:MAG: tol-pal system protein YbgF [Bradyrhizobium sp.]|nr:tol-pal system protein YbgF [Bradyrhizobium sp.]
MSSRCHRTIGGMPRGITRALSLAATLALGSQVLPSAAFAQSDDGDPQMQIERLENQLRQLTGQNEELQHQNQLLQERLRMPGGAQAGPGGQPAAAQPNVAGLPAQPNPNPNAAYRSPQPQPGYGQQIAAPTPVVQEPMVAPGRSRGDAFDPNQNPNAPGAPHALGGGQMPLGAPGGRAAGEPLNIESTNQLNGGGALPPPQAPGVGTRLTTLPPSATPRDEFDLGIGYMERKDYALAEETMRNFGQKYPNDPLLADSQYWLGESFFQRQQYREAAEAFLAVTSKFDKSAKAPDALLRLGQSLAALKEKEAACAAFGEVTRKYPRASSGVKAAVDREQKRVKC